jgi:hypothetical protein
MRIHSDTLSPMHIIQAAHHADRVSGALVRPDRLQKHGSRSHARSFDVTLFSDGTLSRLRSGSNRDLFHATWDQWGYFLAYIFAADPGAMVPRVYGDAADFHDKTGGKFTSFDGYTYAARTQEA